MVQEDPQVPRARNSSIYRETLMERVQEANSGEQFGRRRSGEHTWLLHHARSVPHSSETDL